MVSVLFKFTTLIKSSAKNAEPKHSPDGKKRGGADAASMGGAAGDAGRYALI
jgi:hypothetical protein